MTGRDLNNAAMRPSTLTPLKAFERKLDDLRVMLGRLDHDMLAELWRRAEHSSSADGYPASSMGSGVRSQNPDTSVESAALRGYPGPKPDEEDGGGADPATRPERPDAVAAALAEAITEVSEAHGLMRRVDRRLVFAKAVGESHRGRVAEGSDCGACDEFVSGAPEDRLRSGFCEACYRAWLRYRTIPHDDPGAHRRRFIHQRREDLKGKMEDGKASG